MSDTEKAVFNVHIRGTMKAVWREITKTGELQQCFFNMRMHTDGLKPGGQIRMRSANGKYTTVVGEILEVDPPHRFSHTFRFTQYEDALANLWVRKRSRDAGRNTASSTVDTSSIQKNAGGGDYSGRRANLQNRPTLPFL